MLLQALGASAADKEMRDILTCPISLEIMSDPVSCADGEHKTLTVTSGNLLIFLVYVCRFHQGAGCAVPRGIMLTLVVNGYESLAAVQRIFRLHLPSSSQPATSQLTNVRKMCSFVRIYNLICGHRNLL